MSNGSYWHREAATSHSCARLGDHLRRVEPYAVPTATASSREQKQRKELVKLCMLWIQAIIGGGAWGTEKTWDVCKACRSLTRSLTLSHSLALTLKTQKLNCSETSKRTATTIGLPVRFQAHMSSIGGACTLGRTRYLIWKGPAGQIINL